MQGEHDKALAHYEEALVLFRALDDKEVIGIVLVGWHASCIISVGIC